MALSSVPVPFRHVFNVSNESSIPSFTSIQLSKSEWAVLLHAVVKRAVLSISLISFVSSGQVIGGFLSCIGRGLIGS